jgi:neopullulanase
MEIDDDEFWQEFRHVVKDANPEAYIVGEIWDEAQRWLQGDQFDAVMNYIFAWSSMSFFGSSSLRDDYDREHYKLEPLSPAEFAETIDYMHDLYDWEINQAQLNLLDSHDTARALWIMGDDTSALKLTALYQMTMPGAPCVYYGDEIGMSSGDDPYCREAFPWDDEASWDNALRDHYKAAIQLRNDNPVLRTGDFTIIYAEDRVLGFERNLDNAHALVFFNQSDHSEDITIDLPQHSERTFRQAWPVEDAGSYTPDDSTFNMMIPARSGMVLIST